MKPLHVLGSYAPKGDGFKRLRVNADPSCVAPFGVVGPQKVVRIPGE